MRVLLFILSIGLLVSCFDKKVVVKENAFYYLLYSEHHTSDTIKYEEFNGIGQGDELIAREYFRYRNKEHLIKMYTSDNHAPVDGGRLYYTLDSIGTIYSKSTTWYTSIMLQSNNDSINCLINSAYAYILLKPGLHCYQCRQIETTSKVFLPPVIKEE